MKKSIFGIAALTIVLCFALSGCSLKIFSIDEMMHPPKLSGVNSGIQEAFEKAVSKKNITMKTPTAGDYRSSYVLLDFDNDGEDEAITFYSNSTDETVVYMHLLDSVDGKWTSIADIKGLGSEVYKIDFCDMNGDGVLEIVVCWSLYESRGNKIVSVYEPDISNGETVLKSIISENFSQIITCDMNGDGRDEIFNVIIDNTSGVNKTYGRLLKMNDDYTISLAGNIELTPAVSISSIKAEELTEELNNNDNVDASDNSTQLTRVFIDSVINDTDMITDVVYWDKSADMLVSPLTAANSAEVPATLRSSRLSSVDIDKDGEFEVPLNYLLPNSYSKIGDTQEPLFLTSWYQFKDGAFTEKSKKLMLYSSSYMFTFDETILNSVSVTNDISERVCIFYKYNEKTGKTGNEIFRIVTIPAADWQHRPKRDYSILYESDTLVYVCKITVAGENMAITDDYLKSNFSVIE